jgi:sulfopyruvate decarboxylase subunit alpha
MSAVADGSLPEYATAFIDALHEAGVDLVAALPDSLLKHVYHGLADDERIRYVPVSNEAELPGIVIGAYLGGRRPLMIMENSGLRQACEPIARFAYSHHTPFVMVVTYRGDLGERNWWGHSHAQTMKPLLDALRIPYWVVRQRERLAGAISGALTHADSSQWPVALIVSGDCVNGGQHAAD